MKAQKWTDMVAIGSSFGVTWAKFFLIYFEKNSLQSFPLGVIITAFMMMKSLFFLPYQEFLKAFENFLNPGHVNISDVIGNEKQNRMLFLDVFLSWCKDRIFI